MLENIDGEYVTTSYHNLFLILSR